MLYSYYFRCRSRHHGWPCPRISDALQSTLCTLYRATVGRIFFFWPSFKYFCSFKKNCKGKLLSPIMYFVASTAYSGLSIISKLDWTNLRMPFIKSRSRLPWAQVISCSSTQVFASSVESRSWLLEILVIHCSSKRGAHTRVTTGLLENSSDLLFIEWGVHTSIRKNCQWCLVCAVAVLTGRVWGWEWDLNMMKKVSKVVHAFSWKSECTVHVSVYSKHINFLNRSSNHNQTERRKILRTECFLYPMLKFSLTFYHK